MVSSASMLFGQGSGRLFSEEVMVVSNYSNLNNPLEMESLSINELLRKGVRGFILHLQLNPDIGYVQAALPTGDLVQADSLLKPISDFLDTHHDQVIVLFVHAGFSSYQLMDLFSGQGLRGRLLTDEKRGQWPSASTMAAGGKQLIVFTYQEFVARVPGVNYLWDYAVEPIYSIELEPEFDGSFSKGKPSNPFLYFAGYNLPVDTAGVRIPYKYFKVNENPFLVSHLINLWKKCGKKPNFIVVNKFSQDAVSIMYNLQAHLSLSGQISHNAHAVDQVHWDGDFKAVTSGGFSFPYMYGESVKLVPDKPGFRMEPKSIQLSNIEKEHSQHIRALQLDIHNDLIGFFPFDQHFNDKGPVGVGVKNEGAQFFQDEERGKVLAVYEGDQLVLPNAQDLDLYDGDFTASAWVKVDTFARRDLTILGNEQNFYRSGLHLQLRNRRPYMGFFSNDLQGNSVLQKERWYYLTWRYTKKGGEMAIFVNGELDNHSFGHPSFMGTSPLLVGKAICMNNSFCGKIDDLAIWRRPLGNEEIWNLYQDVYDLEKVPLILLFQNKLKWVPILVLLLLLVIIVIAYRYNRSGRQKVQVEVLEKEPIRRNSILLFGGFAAYNKDGEDVSLVFTTKVRMLFIALLLYSLKSKKGISSDELNHLIWPELSKKNAANNRGVTMNKLRQILIQFEGIEIVNHNDMWRLELDTLFCDYAECLKTIKKADFTKDPSSFSDLCALVHRGSLLNEMEYEWLDEFKGDVASEIIDAFIRFMEAAGDSCLPELTIKLCDLIFEVDPFNEEAIHLKTKALKKMGQHNKAKFAYQSFAQRYEDAMGTVFGDQK